MRPIAEIITKKVYHRGSEVKPRDVFDIAAAARGHRADVVAALRSYPDEVTRTLERLDKLNPDFVTATIKQLMILPAYLDMAADSLATTKGLLNEVLSK